MDGENEDRMRDVLKKKREEMLRNTLREFRLAISGEEKGSVGAGMEEGDMSLLYQTQNMRSRHLDAQRETVKKIDAALRRIKEGTYGICAECGDEIGDQRLHVIPFATLCRECQEDIERRRRCNRS